MYSWIVIILLAIFQGTAEFLPISSSGHLAIFNDLFKISSEDGELLTIVLHAGSLLAIVVYYCKTLLGFLKKTQFHLLKMLVLASLPVVIIGYIVKKSGLNHLLFGDMLSVAMGFLITASILRLTGKRKLRADNETELNDISVKQALATGFAQALALIPGISRSGSTISAGYLSGIKFEAAATFSFLLTLPAIAGASVLEIISSGENIFDTGKFTVLQLATAFIISTVVSYFALKFLLKIIKKGKFEYFSWYLFFLGAAIMVWQIIQLNNIG